MSGEKFCLKWNEFQTNIASTLREIRDDKEFFDVTLACEDQEQVQAHKVVLAVCSPFFRAVLQRNPHDHPLIYLKGVKFVDLAAVLNFMYMGEVNVAQEELNNFLLVADELKIKGLSQTLSCPASKGSSSAFSSSGRGSAPQQQHSGQPPAVAGVSCPPPAKRQRVSQVSSSLVRFVSGQYDDPGKCP
jgi:hypothetical protein